MHPEAPLISVIIPVYNVEDYLPRCIQSVLDQTYTNIELILVNDGSTDNSHLICNDYAQRDARVKTHNQKNGGQSSARNSGLEIATGEYLFFVDSDDYISGDCLEALYHSMVAHQSDCSVTAPLLVYEEKEIRKTQYNIKGEEGVLSSDEAISTALYREKFDVAVYGKLFKRFLFENIRFPHGQIHEDAAVIYRVFHLCGKVSYISEAKYYYIKRSEGNTTSEVGHTRVSSVIEITETMLDYIENNLPNCYNAAVHHLTRTQLALCLKMRLSDDYMKHSFRHMTANVKRYRSAVIRDKKAEREVRLCCLLTYAGFSLTRLIWKIYRKGK